MATEASPNRSRHVCALSDVALSSVSGPAKMPTNIPQTAIRLTQILAACLVAPKGESSGHILSREFTLASLAFLCSRLLTASRRARAATVLQRAWRRVLARRLVHRRVMAKGLAQQCAAVVQTRDRILWAKEVIVKWWRQRDRLRKRRGAVGRKPLLLHSKQRGRRFGTVR